MPAKALEQLHTTPDFEVPYGQCRAEKELGKLQLQVDQRVQDLQQALAKEEQTFQVCFRHLVSFSWGLCTHRLKYVMLARRCKLRYWKHMQQMCRAACCRWTLTLVRSVIRLVLGIGSRCGVGRVNHGACSETLVCAAYQLISFSSSIGFHVSYLCDGGTAASFQLDICQVCSVLAPHCLQRGCVMPAKLIWMKNRMYS